MAKNELEEYIMRAANRYESTLSNLIKKHYKRERKGKEKFKEQLDEFYDDLLISPHDTRVGKSEKFPKDCHKEKIYLKKRRWCRLPGLNGESSKGRIIYLIDERFKIVTLLWAYTHREYKLRPPENELKEEIEKAYNNV